MKHEYSIPELIQIHKFAMEKIELHQKNNWEGVGEWVVISGHILGEIKRRIKTDIMKEVKNEG